MSRASARHVDGGVRTVDQTDAVGSTLLRRSVRLSRLVASRFRSYEGLRGSASLDELRDWGAHNHILGFNTSVIRCRIVFALAEAIGATHFIETGTYHAATAICARRCLRLPVWTSELALGNYVTARMMTIGLEGIAVHRSDSGRFLGGAVGQLAKRFESRPIVYLDAHGGVDETSCPLIEELQSVLRFPTFVAVLDDFEVPGAAFLGRTYGSVSLGVDLLRETLLSEGISRVLIPAYPPAWEQGNGRAGWVVAFRAPAVDEAVRKGEFPWGLLSSYELA